VTAGPRPRSTQDDHATRSHPHERVHARTLHAHCAPPTQVRCEEPSRACSLGRDPPGPHAKDLRSMMRLQVRLQRPPVRATAWHLRLHALDGTFGEKVGLTLRGRAQPSG